MSDLTLCVLENSSTYTFANSEHSHEGSLIDQKDKHRPNVNRAFETDEFESIRLQDNQPRPSYTQLSDYEVINMTQKNVIDLTLYALENSSTCTFANSEHSHEGSLIDQKDKHR